MQGAVAACFHADKINDVDVRQFFADQLGNLCQMVAVPFRDDDAQLDSDTFLHEMLQSEHGLSETSLAPRDSIM